MQHLYRALLLSSIFFCFQLSSTYGNGLIAVRNLIATTVLPDGTVSVPANCFIVGEFCTVDEVLISTSDGTTPGAQPPPLASPTLFLDCSNVGITVVNIWVLSTSGNWTAYETAVFLQDNLGVCGGGTSPFEFPSLQVMQGLAYGIDGSGETPVHASDFVSAYTLPNGGSPVFSFSADPADTLRVLSCGDPETNIFEIHLHDGQGGPSTFVITYALLTDEEDLCTTGGAGQSFPVYNGLCYTLPETGQLTIRAADFLTCCPNDSLAYAFSPDPEDQLLTISCDGQIPGAPNTILVPIYGIEPGGNYSISSTYLQLYDLYGYCSQGTPPPSNDDACNAMPLMISTPPCPLLSNNINATAQPGEPAPPDGGCDTQSSWCDGQGAENTVWFSFEAPASGSVNIRAQYFDTQLALWEADSCQAITGGNAILVAANDNDPSSTTGEALLESITCLIPGKTYYLQADGHAGATGPFELIIEDAGLSCGLAESLAECTPAANTPALAGNNIWRHAYDASGGLIASVADGGSNLGAISVEYQVNDGDIRLDGAGAPYLDRNWSITVENQPAGPVRLRLYFTQEEFLALQNASPLIEMPEDLSLTRVSDGECGDYISGGTLISQERYGLINDTDYYVDFLISGFSALYLNGPEALVSGISGPEEAAAIRIAPNPVQGEAFLHAAVEQPTEARLLLFDARGQLVNRQMMLLRKGVNRLPIQLSTLSAGIYFVRISSEEIDWSGRLIIH